MTKDLFTDGMHYNGGMKNDIKFDERMRTGARCSITKTGLRLRAPFPRHSQVHGGNFPRIGIYQVNGRHILRTRIQGKTYSVSLGAKVDEEAWKRGLERALRLLSERAQASSGPRGPR